MRDEQADKTYGTCEQNYHYIVELLFRRRYNFANRITAFFDIVVEIFSGYIISITIRSDTFSNYKSYYKCIYFSLISLNLNKDLNKYVILKVCTL